MKKIIALTVAFLAIACNKTIEKEGNLHLTGTVEGLKKGNIYVQQLKDTSLITIDTIKFEGKSSFDTKFSIDEPQMLYLYLDRGQTNSIDNNLSFFAEPGEMTFKTTLKEFYANAKFTGSKNQEIYEKYLSIKTNLGNENAELLAKFVLMLKYFSYISFFAEPGEMTFKTTLKEFYANAKFTGSKNQEVYEKYLSIKTNLGNENAELLAKELKNLKKKDPNSTVKIESEKEKLIIRKYLYTANFAVVNGKSEVAPYIALTEIPDANLKLMDTIQKSMSPKVAKSKYGKRLTEWIKERKQTEQE
jgi:hypothetical protein